MNIYNRRHSLITYDWENGWSAAGEKHPNIVTIRQITGHRWRKSGDPSHKQSKDCSQMSHIYYLKNRITVSNLPKVLLFTLMNGVSAWDFQRKNAPNFNYQIITDYHF